jgi:hypothetical protein
MGRGRTWGVSGVVLVKGCPAQGRGEQAARAGPAGPCKQFGAASYVRCAQNLFT